jgi:hypothetical protein
MKRYSAYTVCNIAIAMKPTMLHAECSVFFLKKIQNAQHMIFFLDAASPLP